MTPSFHVFHLLLDWQFAAPGRSFSIHPVEDTPHVPATESGHRHLRILISDPERGDINFYATYRSIQENAGDPQDALLSILRRQVLQIEEPSTSPVM